MKIEDLLIKYLLNQYSYLNKVLIVNFNIDGATCCVTWKYDESGYCRETETINIWDMLIFLNASKPC